MFRGREKLYYNNLLKRINEECQTPLTLFKDGTPLIWNVGHFFLDSMSAGYKLVQCTNSFGAETDISDRYKSAECKAFVDGYLKGILKGKELANVK
jgi:hypothetical protein